MADIPDGADGNVARVAIAWEMVKKAYPDYVTNAGIADYDATLRQMVNAYIKVWRALIEETPLTEATK